MEVKKGNVVYIGGFELPDKNAAAHRVIANGKILKELGYTVCFIGIDGEAEKADLSSFRYFEGFKYCTLASPNKISHWLKYAVSIEYVKKVINELEGVEIVIAYNYPSIALIRLNNFCSNRNIRLVSDCTEWYNPKCNNVRNIAKRIDTFLRMRIVHPKLSGIVTISEFLYKFYQKRMKNVLKVPPLVDMLEKKWINTNVLSEGAITLAYAGSPGMGSKDKLHTIIKAIEQVSSILESTLVLNIVGITKEEYTRFFKDKYLARQINGTINFKGRLSHKDTLSEIKAANFAIIIRDNNLVNKAGFPTKLVEAISCGVPILTNDYSDVKEYIRNGINGFILDASSESQLVKSLLSALSCTNKDREVMRRHIESENIFDYRRYREQFDQFMVSINNPV